MCASDAGLCVHVLFGSSPPQTSPNHLKAYAFQQQANPPLSRVQEAQQPHKKFSILPPPFNLQHRGKGGSRRWHRRASRGRVGRRHISTSRTAAGVERAVGEAELARKFMDDVVCVRSFDGGGGVFWKCGWGFCVPGS
ncbi:hypothetical protein M409DRAFT_53926 [Zasmidium cellare ATCC 36951]|uniref:Uncharacterized protein n=1 Tax=Zasmidium cellare ATCC 36951 TaxID=1080233 RepID=A0A6A6CN31_ZASCE|nr:uncharacterized protein M409DRAFT_53926 [Zasmidium cellare ATCC 36951]KAF2167322.1 hypothetical protein M409DRAFT_53926 [Zasmidium cellare ATCC 36951]